MKVMTARAGGLCVSTRGRDRGRLYVITGTEGSFLLLADGRARPVENPKRKNLRHVTLLPGIYEGDLAGRAADERIAAWLRPFADRYGG